MPKVREGSLWCSASSSQRRLEGMQRAGAWLRRLLQELRPLLHARQVAVQRLYFTWRAADTVRNMEAEREEEKQKEIEKQSAAGAGALVEGEGQGPQAPM